MVKIRKVHSLWLLFFFLVGTSAPVFCFADDVYTIVVKKQENKDKYRWSLSDWLETRDRMRLQDLWLALNTSAPYEFYLDGNYQFNQNSPGSAFNASELGLAAFVTIFGLEAKFDAGIDQHWSGVFDLRVFGFHDQSTHLTFQLGLRSTNSSGGSSYRNGLGGVKLAIYFARPFGIQALYQHYFSSTSNATGVTYTGDKFQGGVFLEFKFLRLYTDYLLDTETLATTSGFLLGTRIYF